MNYGKHITLTWAHRDEVNGSKKGLVFQVRAWRFMVTGRIDDVCSISFAIIWRFSR